MMESKQAPSGASGGGAGLPELSAHTTTTVVAGGGGAGGASPGRAIGVTFSAPAASPVRGTSSFNSRKRRTSFDGSAMQETHQNVHLPGHRAVFVSDMSGFTRITRKCGITHFASLILKMRQIVWPLLAEFDAEIIQPHADNFYAIFGSVEAAVRAAAAISTAITRYNATREGDFKVKLSGMGISWGPDVRNLGHTLHGIPVQQAFVLGEDVSSGGEVLLTAEAWQQLATVDSVQGLQFEKRVAPHPNAGAAEGIPDTIEYFECTNAQSQGETVEVEEFNIPDVDGQQFFEFAMERLENPSRRADIDARIAEKFIGFRVALMFGQHGEEALTKSRGLDYSLRLQRVKHDLIRPIFLKNDAFIAEPCLVFFKTCQDAFLAAIELRSALHQYNAEHPSEPIPVDCIGVHCGSVLLVPGTDIHWGDPVNTASKLAEDIGEHGQVLLSEAFFRAMEQLAVFREQESIGRIRYNSRDVVVSKVQLTTYEMIIGKDESEEHAVSELVSIFRRVGKKIQSMGKLVRAQGSTASSGRRLMSSPGDSTRSLGSVREITGADPHDNRELEGLITPGARHRAMNPSEHTIPESKEYVEEEGAGFKAETPRGTSPQGGPQSAPAAGPLSGGAGGSEASLAATATSASHRSDVHAAFPGARRPAAADKNQGAVPLPPHSAPDTVAVKPKSEIASCCSIQ